MRRILLPLALFKPEIANTWLGFVGPGVSTRGIDDRTWSDHADVRPTILALLGLRDTYVHDGRALIEAIEERAQPVRLRSHTARWGNCSTSTSRSTRHSGSSRSTA